MNEYLFMIIIVTNPKACQITQQSRIDNPSKTQSSKLQTSKT